ncbi:DUF916 domain-containing protein [Candidatus Peregrinibacteria bacterium]|nr:MAG: DUF916 domain-containing protein [Candidatus Peregrinibacteria bacterium]
MKKQKQIAVAILSFLFVSFPTSALGIGYGGIGGEPAYPDPSIPKSDSIFLFTLHSGENEDGGLRVINNTDEEKRIHISSVDAETATGGAFSCQSESASKEEVGKWIALESDAISLPPFSNVIVPFRVLLPENVSPGSHEGCLVLEDSDQIPEEHGGIRLRFRTGIRVSITVPGNIYEKIISAGLSVAFRQKEDGETKILLQPKVKNMGNISLEAEAKVSARPLFSWKEPKIQSALFPISKGETVDWNFEMPSPFWGGVYRAESSFEYTKNQYSEASIEKDDKAEAKYSTSLQTNMFSENTTKSSLSTSENVRIPGETVWFFVTPSPVAMAIEVSLLSFLFLLGFLRWISYWRKKWILFSWIPHIVQKGETLYALAEQHDVAWKIVAKANKLHAPYHFQGGEKILLPPEEQ